MDEPKLLTEMRTEYGRAARANRGSYSGRKTHRLICYYIVGVEPGYDAQPGTLAARFLLHGRPVLTWCSPACGCTRGQWSGRPIPGASPGDVDCGKCGK